MIEVKAEIWTITSDVTEDLLSVYLADLNSTEIERSDRYRRQEDRINFVVSRATLKRLIASKLSINLSEVAFKENRFGKPFIIGGYPLDFNLSHSGKMIIIGFADNHRIGVDVEHMKGNIEYKSIAKHHFAPKEVEILSQRSDAEMRDYFYRCWTRKESFIKAEGSGVSYPLDSFVVSMDSSHEASLLSLQNPSEDISEWSMHSFIPAENYIAAVTVNSARSGLKLKTWDHSSSLR